MSARRSSRPTGRVSASSSPVSAGSPISRPIPNQLAPPARTAALVRFRAAPARREASEPRSPSDPPLQRVRVSRASAGPSGRATARRYHQLVLVGGRRGVGVDRYAEATDTRASAAVGFREAGASAEASALAFSR